MAIDLEKMKKKAEELENKKRGNKEDDKTRFSPSRNVKKGEKKVIKVRFLPDKDGDPFLSFHYHYNLKGGQVLCLKRNYDEKCPICEYATETYFASKKAEDEDGMKFAKGLFAQEKYASNVFVREQEADGPKVWGAYSEKIYKKLIAAVLNPDIGDITDPENGYDVEITVDRMNMAKDFPDIDIDIARRPSKLSKTKQEIKEILEGTHDLKKTAGEKLSYEEMGNRLQKTIDSVNKSEEETEQYKTDEEQSVDEAVEKLVGSSSTKEEGTNDDIPF